MKNRILFVVALCVISSTFSGVTAKNEEFKDNTTSASKVPVFAMRDIADLIVVANLQKIPYSINYANNLFYRIVSTESLKGASTTNDMLIADYGGFHWYGREVAIETNVIYILFLCKAKQSGSLTNANYYQLYDAWHGIIPTTADAKERRAIKGVMDTYGYQIDKNITAFKDALKFGAQRQTQGWNSPEEHLGPEAMEVYKALGLDRIADSGNAGVILSQHGKIKRK